ncbi:MAG: hypothetical protein KJ760_20095 [Proteobacteria bacterium]|nr:hypothetical protein [Pseudomonadota bacterium]
MTQVELSRHLPFAELSHVFLLTNLCQRHISQHDNVLPVNGLCSSGSLLTRHEQD